MTSFALNGSPPATARSSAVRASGTMNIIATYTTIAAPFERIAAMTNAMRMSVTSIPKYAARPLQTPAIIAPSGLRNRRFGGGSE
jgi:hypothetical protein